MLFGPGVYKLVLEMSPVVGLSSFWVAMSPQTYVLFFKAQGRVPDGGVAHRTCFQASGDCLPLCKHMALALAGLWECDTINLPGLPKFVFQPLLSRPQTLSRLAC